MSEIVYHYEEIELPSKGWFYPTTSPLSSGVVKLYYMTAKHEDILTNPNYIKRGVSLDRLMEALLYDKDVRIDDLLLGDKNGILIAARIMAYGKDYGVTVKCPNAACEHSTDLNINLENLKEKPIEFEKFPKGVNEFVFVLPTMKNTIRFKLITHKDERDLENETQALAKLGSVGHNAITASMMRMIISVDGNSDKKHIREFVNSILAKDARAFRAYARSVNPNIDLTFSFECPHCGYTDESMEVPLDGNFFWPDQ